MRVLLVFAAVTGAVLTFTAAQAAAATGAMQLSPDPVDYHRVTVGRTESKRITVRNIGETQLNILAYRVGDHRDVDTWRINNSTCGTLSVGDRCRFELEVTPGATGDITGWLDVWSYSYETATYDVISPPVSLLGKAVPKEARE